MRAATIEEVFAALPQPDRIEVEGLQPGETPELKLTYMLGENDAALEKLLGAIFTQAKEKAIGDSITLVIR